MAKAAKVETDDIITPSSDIKFCTIKIRGTATYGQSKQIDILQFPKKDKERDDDYDKRLWREHINSNADGHVVIKNMAIKQCIDRASKMIGMRIPGKNTNTYSKHFLSGYIIEDDALVLMDGKPIKKADVECVRLPCSSTGVRGSGKRVWRHYPIIHPNWTATFNVMVLDAQLTKDVFEYHVHESGKYVGLGRFRPEVGGTNGRFAVTSIEWR